MTRKIINVGTADKGNGDPIRVAFSKANDNFAELYNILSNNTGGSIITTDVIGSVFADDSTLLVDGINGSIPYSVLSGAPTIPAAQVQSNWTASSGMGVILNKPTLFSGSYTDLTSKPTLFSGSYTDLTSKPTIPTLVSQLANDSGFLTSVSNISNIRSEGNVNIEINLTDSTKRIWRFGEDGDLTFPNNTVQTDAFSGKSGKTAVLGTNASAPGEFGIALGFNAGANGGAGDYAIALGYGAGLQNQGGGATNTAVAIGMSAGSTNQGARGIAIGRECGASTQGISAIAIGDAAGNGNQGQYSIALGAGTALTTQGIRSIAIGTGAGGLNQGDYAIAIGNYAGTSNQHTNSIILNARSSVLNTATSDSFYVAPIRNASGTSGVLQYNAATKEVSYSSDIRSEGNVNIDINLSDSTLRRWQFGEDGDTVFPNNVSINYSGNNVQFPRIIADSGKAFSIQGQGNSGSTALSWTVNPDAASQYAAVSVSRAGGDNLAKVVLQAQSNSGDAGTAKTWKFNETGTLTLPAGGTITEGGGFTGAIKLTPSGGANEYQALLIYPTAGADGDHIHLTAAGGTTELYLGSDNHYVKLASGGVVRIQADDGVASSAAWVFGTNGELALPNNGKITSGVDAAQVGSTTTIALNSLGTDQANNNINVGIEWTGNEAVFTTYAAGSTITFANGDVRTITDIQKNEVYGEPGVFAIDIYWSTGTPRENLTAFPITLKTSNYAAAYTAPEWRFGTNGSLTFPDSTVQTTAARPFSFSVAADDSTQRAISNNESIKFTGAGGVTTASDAEGNITITGSKVIGSWTVTNGTSTYSFTLPSDGTYVMWVKGNIANGIITWNATASVTNTNVPAIGSQYAWNYTGGGSPILLTAIPDQIRGSAGTISTDATYAGTTSNRFDFGISNTSGASQTVYYGYTKIS
jgi:hypothetical protein